MKFSVSVAVSREILVIQFVADSFKLCDSRQVENGMPFCNCFVVVHRDVTSFSLFLYYRIGPNMTNDIWSIILIKNRPRLRVSCSFLAV